NENKIDRERQRAGASAQNEWQKRDGGQHEKEAQNGEGRGNKRRQSQSGRDVGGAKHETGTVRTTNDTDESGRKQELKRREHGIGTKQISRARDKTPGGHPASGKPLSDVKIVLTF
ncbi:hypothetical protein TNCV_594931, partial [Trichonephila clavipes]